MLRTYLDESEHPESAAFGVCGYVFDAVGGRRFHKEWKRLFGDRLSHMVDLAHRKEDFDGISVEERDRLVKAAVRTINRRALYGVGAFCWANDVEVLLAEFQGIPGCSTVYGICSFFSLLSVGIWAEDFHPSESVHYVFEDGWRDGFDAQGFMATVSRAEYWRQALRYAGHTFAPKTRHLHLQAADILAYEYVKKCRDMARPERRSFAALLDHDPARYDLRFITPEVVGPAARLIRAVSDDTLHELEFPELKRLIFGDTWPPPTPKGGVHPAQRRGVPG